MRMHIIQCKTCHVQAATTRDGGEIGQLLWQLVAASAHIIVPVAAFNLKARLTLGACREAARYEKWRKSTVGCLCNVECWHI